MSDPRRWKDGAGAPPGVRELLAASPRSRNMTSVERRRTASRVGNLVSVPVAASIAWLWAKGIAIAGVATLSAVTLAQVSSGHGRAPWAALGSGGSAPRHPPSPPAIATPGVTGPLARALELVASEPVVAPPASAAPISPPEPPAAPPEAALPAAEVPAVSSQRAAERARPAPGPVPSVAAAPSQDADLLEKEASLLEAARSALAADPARALALLD